ncbi:hypothetical protein MHYP_G00207250 [Metynnis hypsauchen]
MLCLPVVCNDIADVTQAPLVTMPPSSQTAAVHKWPIDAGQFCLFQTECRLSQISIIPLTGISGQKRSPALLSHCSKSNVLTVSQHLHNGSEQDALSL